MMLWLRIIGTFALIFMIGAYTWHELYVTEEMRITAHSSGE